jgi:hypothetical protein
VTVRPRLAAKHWVSCSDVDPGCHGCCGSCHDEEEDGHTTLRDQVGRTDTHFCCAQRLETEGEDETFRDRAARALRAKRARK